METIKELGKIDFIEWLVVGFFILSAIISIATIIGKFSIVIGKPVKWYKKQQSDHELLIRTAQNLDALQKKHEEDVRQSIKHDQLIKNDLLMVSDKMDAISIQISDMQHKIDETEIAKLKDKLLTYYNKYKNIGVWSRLEYEAFWELFGRYEAHGGNGYIHETVEPIMRELKIVD